MTGQCGPAVRGRRPVEPGIVVDLDRLRVGSKARAPVEGDGARVVEVAGVNPEAGDRPRPGPPERLVHEGASGA